MTPEPPRGSYEPPVFVDPSGRRRRLLKLAGAFGALSAVLLVAVIVGGLASGGQVPLGSWPDPGAKAAATPPPGGSRTARSPTATPAPDRSGTPAPRPSATKGQPTRPASPSPSPTCAKAHGRCPDPPGKTKKPDPPG